MNIRTKLKEISHITRWSLYAIITLFILSRIVVYLIMSHMLPSWLFFNVNGTHIHHYVYGVFMMLGLSTYLTYRQHVPKETEQKTCGFIYGIALTLIFDEFMMWLTFTNNYYSNISIDSIIVIVCVLIGTSLFPKFKKLDTWTEAIIAWTLVIIVGIGLALVFNDGYKHFNGKIEQLNKQSPH